MACERKPIINLGGFDGTTVTEGAVLSPLPPLNGIGLRSASSAREIRIVSPLGSNLIYI